MKESVEFLLLRVEALEKEVEALEKENERLNDELMKKTAFFERIKDLKVKL